MPLHFLSTSKGSKKETKLSGSVAVVLAGHTITHTVMSDGHQVTLKHFGQLSQRRNRYDNITLTNADGVQIFSYTLSHSTYTQLHLFIDMRVFSDHVNTATPETIQSNSVPFRRLVELMLKQQNLQDVKIVAFTPSRPAVSATSPPDANKMSAAMSEIFSYRDLRKLEMRELRFVLQLTIDIKCFYLQELRLDGE